MSHSPSRDVLITPAAFPPDDDTATIQVQEVQHPVNTNHGNTVPSSSRTTTFSLSNAYIDHTTTTATPPQQTIIDVGSPTPAPDVSNPQDPARKQHALRRFFSYIFTKSSSLITGYRFVNFPGLRAHNNIKDTYQRLAVSYYSVYFVFHLFFSISSR